MKLSIALTLFLTTSTTAFSPSSTFSARSATSLFNARVDSAAAVEAALAATKKFGATSPEARVAWDVVEEMDSSDNSAAFAGGLDTECELEDDGSMSKACAEYEAKLKELNTIIASSAPKIQELKSLATEMRGIKVGVASAAPSTDSPQLREAMAYARKMAKEHGDDSKQAIVAWTEVEEIASSGLSNAMGGRLDQECLVESAVEEACVALEELNAALNLEMSKDGGLNA